MNVWQLLITLKTRVTAFIGTLHSLVLWKNAWKTAAKYALLCALETLLTPANQHCPEPGNAEEHDLQDEEDKSYVRGRIAYVMLQLLMLRVLNSSVDLLKKILEGRASPAVSTPLMKVNGAKPLTSKQHPSSSMLSAKMIRLPSHRLLKTAKM